MAIPQEKLNELKELLIDDQTRIKEKLELLKNMDFGDSPGADNEEADETEEMANKLGTIEALEERVENIGAALERIEAGAYGTCEKCGGEIELEVLEVNPEGALCKGCKV